MFWACSHLLWRLISSEAGNTRSGGTGGSDIDGGDGVATPAWVWVDLGIAWAIAPAAGGSLQLSLWGSIVPSWLCVTGALAFGLRAEEVRAEEINRTFCMYGILSNLRFTPDIFHGEKVLEYYLRRQVTLGGLWESTA